ncbi:unnamed protein product [Plasmodium vivax]|uniref:(malaria parasite P. vivax) hypothetical protein n=1 Tax=Plasmodium vivax TaxID=5855 RepID=A0A8S4H556_PLAVI|nr:unnamed protein product [Plasmodium vivax]
MSDKIIDIADLKRNYPFLNTVWDTYNEFNKPVEGDENKYMYHTFCDPLMNRYKENKEKQSNFCLKLVRNLGCYPPGYNPYFDPNDDRCKILNYWIYNLVRKHQISDTIITECFDDYNRNMRIIGQKGICHYYSYDDIYKDPVNMIILEIFQSYMKIVTDMLNKENHTINSDLQMYICECVNIYKEMDKTYCRNNDEDKKRIFTCSMLNTFRDTYKFFLSATQNKNYNIPSLDDVEKEYNDKCMPSKLEVPLTAPRDNEVPALRTSSEDSDEQIDGYSSAQPFNDEKTGSSISSTVSTAVGTMAGASSILAVLYKFTPGGNWILSGIKGSRGRINSNLYEEVPNEMLFNGFHGEDMSSYNTRYNIGYGSA